jgi:putative toxin-antitoxin system antitoxin component (TIGR02293 family)
LELWRVILIPVVQVEKIAEVMGGPTVLGQPVHSIEELSHAVARGLPKDALRKTVCRIFPDAKQRRMILYRIIPEATYKRRRRLLRPVESERTERLARVVAAAEFVWNDPDKARRWLIKPHPELGDRTPVELALTELGARQVEDLLDRIHYGLPV